ncbi:membrane protein with 6 putative tms [Liquorilactobacillus ghanensis DSM 18630]|uniref:Membrane protein with 6 putative tms n=1 Tax=Liquorilactobacillus ghanensis DSM 18630 TaxID=1423750 RepID=A0A0R1VNY8_9LACO|nr:conjugal transfer protein TrbL family protein [Liquorilactobacillus ghanensis]KRM07544.1 membrane protein with 6 putative tms [Liquorilactobacillus ghanensis DSM 18630]
MTNIISDAINSFIKSIFKNIMDFAVSGCKAIIDQVNQTLPGIKTWYGVFFAFSCSLLIVVVLARIILTLMKEADDSTDVTWANILMDSFKASISIPIMVFLQGFLQSEIIFPLAKYMFSMSGKYSSDAILSVNKITIDPTAKVPTTIPISGTMAIIFLVFFAIVTVAFMIKMCIYYADMAWYTITIPIVAVSIATETFDYGTTWWKKLVYYNCSMLSQVLSLTLCIWCFTHLAKNGFIAFMGAIGFGWLVLHTPHVIQDFWASTGITKSAGRAGLSGLTSMLKNKISG